MKPALFILAAGMSSRYGGLKQLDELGPHGETIMDYSIYDAIWSGFGKLVFVIIVSKYESLIPIEIVYQELDKIPAGYTVPLGREKPWGTNHALLMGKEAIHEPFAVINADDFYRRDSFIALGEYLTKMTDMKNEYCMIGYRLGNTLSKNGTVTRGVCKTGSDGYLLGIVECTSIERVDGEIRFIDEAGKKTVLDENTSVSMGSLHFF
jgi:hypothetical protein